MQEWITSTVLPILLLIIPVWIHLNMKHNNAMEKKVDDEVFNARVEPIEDGIKEIKSNNILLRSDIMDELKYIRTRLDQMADKNQK